MENEMINKMSDEMIIADFAALGYSNNKAEAFIEYINKAVLGKNYTLRTNFYVIRRDKWLHSMKNTDTIFKRTNNYSNNNTLNLNSDNTDRRTFNSYIQKLPWEFAYKFKFTQEQYDALVAYFNSLTFIQTNNCEYKYLVDILKKFMLSNFNVVVPDFNSTQDKI